MIPTPLILSLLSLGSASPVLSRDAAPCSAPSKSTSKGFTLVVNLTDPSTDFDPPIRNSFITSLHTGAGLALVGVSAEKGRVFYQNGTSEESKSGKTGLLSDGGTPPAPSGFELVADPNAGDVSTATLNTGPGTPGVALSKDPEPYTFLLPETYVACNESIPYYGGKYFITVKQVAKKDAAKKIPADCVAVRLIPECAKLAELPEGAISSHEYALDSPCYEDVSAIDWKVARN